MTGFAKAVRPWTCILLFGVFVSHATHAEARRRGRARSKGRATTSAPRASEESAEEGEANEEPAKADASAQRRVAVEGFRGPGGSRIRSQVVAAINDRKKQYRVVSMDDVRDEASRQKINLGSPKSYRAVARELHIVAFIDGEAKRRGRAWGASVRVRNGADGEILDEASWQGRTTAALDQQVRRGFWKRLGSSLESATAPAGKAGTSKKKEEPAGSSGEVASKGDDETPATETSGEEGSEVASKDEEHDESESTDESEAGTSAGTSRVALDAQLGLRFFSRSFAYKDDIFQAQRPYSLPLAPAAQLAVDFYPGALFAEGILTRIGLTGGYEQAFGLKSSDSKGVQYPTSSSAFWFGLRARFPVGPGEVGGTLAYGIHKFAIGDAAPDAKKPDIPDVQYDYIRLGVSGRLELSDLFALSANAAYLAVLSSGQVASADYFPRTSVGGLEAGIALNVRLGLGFEARAGFDLRRYFYSMNPEPGDARIVGGAVDQYLTGTLAIAYRWSLDPIKTLF